MIKILFVVYQTKISLSTDFLALTSNGFSILVFDNSFDKEYLNYNREYCESNHITYLTEGKNIGLSKAYNQVIGQYINDDDHLMILDADTSVDAGYLLNLKNEITPNHPQVEVFSPININRKTEEVDSPLKIRFHPFFGSERVDLKKDCYDFFKVINNGILIKGSALKKIGGFDDNIFLYFSDSYLSFALYEKGIKTLVVDYKNFCDFSFDRLDHAALKKRLKLMKKDGRYFYHLIYARMNKPKILGFIHYQMFCVKKAIECSRNTSMKYFLSYLFSGKEK